MTSKLTAEQIVDAFNLAGVDFPRDRGNVSRLIAAVRALLAPTQQLSGEPSLNNPMVRFPTEEDIREWEEARKRQPSGEPASAGVTAAALAVIEADRAHVLTDDHVDALANAIKIQRGTLKLPEARAKLPRFPVVLCKMWSGGEVQHWIDENVAPRAAALRDALDHIARVARGSREQSRRQRWIELRALGALNGTDEWRTLPLPKNGDGVRRRLVHRISELEAEVERLNAIIAAHPDQPETRVDVTDWQPIETAPADTAVIVFWLDPESPENPERYDFDMLDEGCWRQWTDHYDWAHSVAPAGSRLPCEQPPYTHWKPLGSPDDAVEWLKKFIADRHAARSAAASAKAT
ncbi:hypothetical protein [Burkholderia ubonensis]|uniref:hypothetical protein n=1 Tax=Burkholderia ubonensis TaxID=101571 RepID=UPI000ABCAD13|nr:hypothetical protein [Burkholderia ubonensis]